MRSGNRSGAARLVGSVGLAALVLAGCGEGSPGAAAVVETKRLTVEELQQRTAAFLDAYPEATSSGVTPDLVATVNVENFVRGAVVDAAAADLGVSVTETEIADFITELGGFEETARRTSSRGVPPEPELVRAEVRSALLQRAIGEAAAGPGASDEDIDIATREAVDAMSAELDIQVNPRYGTWDGSLVNQGSGSVSMTIAEWSQAQGGGPATDPLAPVPQG